jgi:formylglycine-generating enzyme required for sulfatase activity
MKTLLVVLLIMHNFSLIDPLALRDPTVVKINDTLYAGISEVTLYQWKQFLFESQKGSSMNKADRKYVQKDSLYWKSIFKRFGGISSVYFLSPAYNMCPVVGISYEEAVAFCEWATLKARSKFKNGYQYTYRLPSESEWEQIASCDNKADKNRKNFIRIYNTSDKIISESDLSRGFNSKSYCCNEEFRLLSIYDSQKNGSGLIHVEGNVSEMVQEKNISKGGSYKQTLFECNLLNKHHYSEPELGLGFRYILVKK